MSDIGRLRGAVAGKFASFRTSISSNFSTLSGPPPPSPSSSSSAAAASPKPASAAAPVAAAEQPPQPQQQAKPAPLWPAARQQQQQQQQQAAMAPKPAEVVVVPAKPQPQSPPPPPPQPIVPAKQQQTTPVTTAAVLPTPQPKAPAAAAAEAVEEEGEEIEDEDDDEDEEEEEPRLRYQRLGGSVPGILEHDSASCMAVHEKFLALGTHEGAVYVLDLNGNQTMRFASHTTTVTELSIDSTGEFLASCSMEGRVVVRGLLSTEIIEFEYSRPVTGLAIDPLFGRKSNKQFCIGSKGGQVSICGKGWLGRQKDTVIHQGEGAIHAVRWRGRLIAWCSDHNTHIYDVASNQRIGKVQRPASVLRPDLYRCCLDWESDTSLIIAMGNSIKIVHVAPRPSAPSTGMSLMPSQAEPQLTVEITHSLEVDYVVCGVSPFEQTSLLVLAYPDDDSAAGVGGERQRPELRVVTRRGDELSGDGIPIRNFERYRAMDYRLDYLANEWLFYLVAPGDIVFAKPRDLDDHVTWLLERQRYEEALAAAEEGLLRTVTYTQIGEQYIEFLLTEGNDPKRAAELCPKIFKRDAALWERWVMRFHELHFLRAITPSVPVGNPQLSQTVYEIVLNQHLKDDHALFLSTITNWPHEIYNMPSIIEAVRKRLDLYPDDKNLLHALARLYTYNGQFGRTLDTYLRLREGPVFKLIAEHDLFDEISDKLVRLMEFDRSEAVKLLINVTDRIPVHQVVSQLGGNPEMLLAFLHALFEKDPNAGAEYHRLQVELYATWDPSKLGAFLRRSTNIPLEDALRVCEQKHFYPEMVFILERMGNVRQALQLIMTQIRDIKMAIEFVSAQNDKDLWEDLITRSINNPEFISGLLENIGSNVDPIRLIQRIPNGQDIPRLRDHLVKILNDYNLQMSLQEGCNVIIQHDCVELFDSLVQSQARPVRVTEATRCAVCQANIARAKPEDVVVFWCSHAYHIKCLHSVSQSQKQRVAAAAAGPGGKPASPAPASAAAAASSAPSSPAPAPSPLEDGQLFCVQCKSAREKRTAKRAVASRPPQRRIGQPAVAKK